MRTLFLALLCVTACSSSSNGKPGASAPLAPSPSAQAPSDAPPEQPAPAAKPAVLEGVGRCVGGVCTMHFAMQATGDVDTFSAARCFEPECQTWRGKLKADGQAKVRALAERLSKERFEPVYGCPGCTDGPTHEVVIHRPDGTSSTHKVDPLRRPLLPPLLGEASALIETLYSTIYRCEATDLFEPAPGCKEILQVELKRPAGIP